MYFTHQVIMYNLILYISMDLSLFYYTTCYRYTLIPHSIFGFTDKPRDTNITRTNGRLVRNDTILQTGETLSCQANSNPGVSKYEWRNNDDALIGQSQFIQLETEQIGFHILTCIVTNYMRRNSDVQGTDFVTLSVNVIGRLVTNLFALVTPADAIPLALKIVLVLLSSIAPLWTCRQVPGHIYICALI